MAVGHVAVPIALVEGAVLPELLATAATQVVPPLADVDVAILELDGCLPLVGEGLFVGEWAELLQGLLHDLVGDLRGGEVGRGRGLELGIHQHEVGTVFALDIVAGLAIPHKFDSLTII